MAKLDKKARCKSKRERNAAKNASVFAATGFKSSARARGYRLAHLRSKAVAS